MYNSSNVKDQGDRTKGQAVLCYWINRKSNYLPSRIYFHNINRDVTGLLFLLPVLLNEI